MLSWVEIGLVFWRRKKNIENSTDRFLRTENRWSEKLTWAFSLGELKKTISWLFHSFWKLRFHFFFKVISFSFAEKTLPTGSCQCQKQISFLWNLYHWHQTNVLEDDKDDFISIRISKLTSSVPLLVTFGNLRHIS